MLIIFFKSSFGSYPTLIKPLLIEYKFCSFYRDSRVDHELLMVVPEYTLFATKEWSISLSSYKSLMRQQTAAPKNICPVVFMRITEKTLPMWGFSSLKWINFKLLWEGYEGSRSSLPETLMALVNWQIQWDTKYRHLYSRNFTTSCFKSTTTRSTHSIFSTKQAIFWLKPIKTVS